MIIGEREIEKELNELILKKILGLIFMFRNKELWEFG